MSNSKAQEIHIVNRHFKLLLMDINSLLPPYCLIDEAPQIMQGLIVN